jgi:hypothetical protein
MVTNTNSPTEVLHSETHSKLSAEQIAKAVARHNRDHSGAPKEGAKGGSAKPKKGAKG